MEEQRAAVGWKRGLPEYREWPREGGPNRAGEVGADGHPRRYRGGICRYAFGCIEVAVREMFGSYP
ncbi:MAG: hypothetical protein HFI93_02165 [Lachnospiraceae bacterium]|nr:hypothetical protein [Lachnospiraceae bacterium]